MSSPPTSPTGAERRASIKKKHDDQMHKKLLEQKALNQKRKMERKRQEIENKRLAELENARDGLISKEERLAMAKANRDKHERELREIEEEKRAVEQEEQRKKWGTILDIGEKLSEINASWYKLDAVPEVIYNSEAKYEMLCLRLIGVGLLDVSERVAETFTNLRSLIIDANKLTKLPKNLFHLHNLKEISAIKNQIVKLPLQMGRIQSLVHLNLANNKLSYLPTGLGMLENLEVLGLENNQLVDLPSMGDLRCRVVRLNHNKLESVLGLFMTEEVHSPWGMSDTLVDLQLNNNCLDRLPPKIGAAKQLERLFLARNKLVELPPSLGHCKQLHSLWLDWNEIEAIPYSFANLKHLHTISANGNPLKKPPPEVLYEQGANGLVKWCGKFNHQTENLTQKAILVALQKILHQVESNPDLTTELQDVFTPNYQPTPPGTIGKMVANPDYDDGGIPKFYGFVWEALWERIIPLVEPQYYELVNIPGVRDDLIDDFFLYTRHEVENAIMEYDDSYGPVGSMGHECMFKQCSCTNSKGRRRVCVPPNAEYRCRRMPCTLVRMKLTSAVEFKKHEIRRAEIKTINAALEDAKKAAEAYLETRPGKRLIKKRGKALAYEIWRDLKERKKERKQERREEKSFFQGKARRQKRRQALEKKGKVQKARLQAKKEELERKLKDFRGTAKDELEDEIVALEYAIEHETLDEDDIQELEDLDREDQEEEDEREERLTEKEVENYENETEEAIEEEKKLVRYERMSWSELRKDCKVTVAEEYVQDQLDEVREKIEAEFEVMRRVMKRWLGAAKKEVFRKWKRASKGRRDRRIANEKRKAKEDKLKKEAAEAQVYLQELEAAKWVEHFDEYTDRIYFEHSETGEIAWDERPKDRGFVLRK
jgi:hypothetical protein